MPDEVFHDLGEAIKLRVQAIEEFQKETTDFSFRRAGGEAAVVQQPAHELQHGAALATSARYFT